MLLCFCLCKKKEFVFAQEQNDEIEFGEEIEIQEENEEKSEEVEVTEIELMEVEEETQIEITVDSFQDVLEYKSISAVQNGYLISVLGNMPENAGLCVSEQMIDDDRKEEIFKLSNLINTEEDYQHAKIVSFDISICVDGNKYEPYEHEENIEIHIQYQTDEEWKDCEAIEIFHVKENEEIEQINISEQTQTTFAFYTESFSQFIFVGEMEYEKETSWDFSYTGDKEFFEAPTKGIYKIDLFGAQGSNYQNFYGGKGGHVSGYIELEKGEVLQIQVGGTNGYLAAGVGTLGNGGGRTVISKADHVIAIAGGGGAAGYCSDGGAGGAQTGLYTEEYGESNASENSAGGGSGFVGGLSGVTYVHRHTGEETIQGGCYQEKESRPVEVIGKKTCSITAVPAGSESVLCKKCGEIIDNIQCTRFMHMGCDRKSSLWLEGFCTNCNEIYESGERITFTSHFYQGPITVVQDFYNLSCGYEEGEIESYTVAYGGSNYMDETYFSDVVREMGIQSGNGRIQISLNQIDVNTFTYFDDMGNELMKTYVEPGTSFSYPLSATIEKETDGRYSYRFLGWDDLSTQEQEKLSGEQTVQDTLSDHSFQAVYEKIPRSYQVTLKSCAEDEKNQSIMATYDSALPDVQVPIKKDWIFDGYYTLENGEGQKIYDAGGNSIVLSPFDQEQMIYANWVNPIEVINISDDTSVMFGYQDISLQVLAIANPVEEYELSYEWFMDGKKIEQEQEAVLQISQGLLTGTYTFECNVWVENKKNHQKTNCFTSPMKLSVQKGYLQQAQIKVNNPVITYNGKEQTVSVTVDENREYEIYYGKEPLDDENYATLGSRVAPSYEHAGKYTVYLYIRSKDYESIHTVRTIEIKKAIPHIELLDTKEVYNGNTRTIKAATCLGMCGELLFPDIRYEYFLDETCLQMTDKEHGAKQPGDAPSEIGTYYVKAYASEMQDYEATETVQPACFQIEKPAPVLHSDAVQNTHYDTETFEKNDSEKSSILNPVIVDKNIEEKENNIIWIPLLDKKEIMIPEEPVFSDVDVVKQEKQIETIDFEIVPYEIENTKLKPKFAPAKKDRHDQEKSVQEEHSKRHGVVDLFVSIIVGFAILRILYGLIIIICRKKKKQEK